MTKPAAVKPELIQEFSTNFAEARLFAPVVFADARGELVETYSSRNYRKFGITDDFVQDLTTWSGRHVIRGPHWDDRMAKFIQVLKGEIFDVIVDMREASPTYRKWQGFYLSDKNHEQLYVPKGFAHGFLTLAEENAVLYKMSAQHDASQEHRIHWRDPAIAIEWPVVDSVTISEKDDAPS